MSEIEPCPRCGGDEIVRVMMTAGVCVTCHADHLRGYAKVRGKRIPEVKPWPAWWCLKCNWIRCANHDDPAQILDPIEDTL